MHARRDAFFGINLMQGARGTAHGSAASTTCNWRTRILVKERLRLHLLSFASDVVGKRAPNTPAPYF